MSPAQLRKSSSRSRSATAAAATSARAPRRCRKCPNNPLKSACGCSKRRVVIPDAESTTQDVDSSSALAESVNVQEGFSSWNALQRFHANSGEPLGIQQEHAEPHNSSAHYPLSYYHSAAPHWENQGIHRELAVPLDSPTHIDNTSGASTVRGGFPSPDIEQSQAQGVLSVPEATDTQPQGQLSVPEATDIGNEHEVPDSGDSNDIGSKIGKRLTLAEKLERFGVVDGVMKGNTIYRVVRQNGKRRPILDASSANTRYNREIPLIISSAERMAVETDTYVLILAQQATGSSASIHFASERLRREAFNQCAGLVNQFQSLMTQLVIAKCSTTLALTQNLEASEMARAQVEQRLAEREVAIASTEAELAATRTANQALLSRLEALRSSLAGPSQQND